MKWMILFFVPLLSLGSLAQPFDQIEVLGTYSTGIFDDSAAEICDYDPSSQQLFVVNGAMKRVDVLSIADPSAPVLLFSIDVSSYGDSPNSLAVHDGILAVAVQEDPKQDNGSAVFFDVNGAFLNSVQVGALPDMLTFTPDGTHVLVANEGEPNDSVTIDPEGSISVIDISNGVTGASVVHATFSSFNGATLDPSIRIFGPGATVAQDLEPEYIAVSPDSQTAYVTCQENNALAIVNINNATVTDLIGLGFKNHQTPGNALDPSNRDSGINIANWPVFGMYQPDAIAAFSTGSGTFLITANEGDSRDYDGFSEEDRVDDLTLDPTVFPDAATLQLDENLGRLKTTTTLGDDDNDGDYDRIFAYGARSFSIWDLAGNLVYDSGDDLEQITASELPSEFNSTNDENSSFDSRSDDKGPEPEGVVIGEIGGTPYAFIGLERIGGIVVYDVSNPHTPQFVQYLNNRDFSGDPETGTAGDLGPEGLLFIEPQNSPNGYPLLVVANEVSGTTTVYQIHLNCAEPEILSVAPVGEVGIVVGGTPDCLYDIVITSSDGSQTTHQVVIGPDGTAILDIMVEPDVQIGVAIAGSGAINQVVETVPTMGEWGIILFIVLIGTVAVLSMSRGASSLG